MQQYSYGFDQPIATDLDLSTVTALFLIVKRPSGAPIERLVDPSLISASTKTIHWHVEAGDLDQTGTHLLQLCDRSEGRVIFTKPSEFYVSENSGPVPS